MGKRALAAMREKVSELLGGMNEESSPIHPNRVARTWGPLALLACSLTPVHAGPPFQTDDPEPIESRHYEFYTFGTLSRTPGEADTVGPAAEFNWGAAPNTHLHIIVPIAGIVPSNGRRSFGLGDIELGIKYKFIQETKHRPMIGTFTMFEIPTGSSLKGLGVGKTWYKVPLWAQKSFGPWTTYGGGGATVFTAPGYRNYPFAAWLVQRDLGKKVTLGTEIYYHGPEGPATPLNHPATLVDIGGYYKFRDPGFQLLYCYGHSAIGKSETYAYLGLYWTWPGKKDDGKKDADRHDGGSAGKPAGIAFSGMGPSGLIGRR